MKEIQNNKDALKYITGKWLFILLIVVQYGFFMLIPVSKITRGLAYTPWVSLLIIFSLICIVGLSSNNMHFKSWIFVFVLINLISVVYIILKYSYFDNTVLSGFGYAISIFAYFPIKKLSREINIYKILIIVNILAIISVIIQALIFNITNHLLIPSIDLSNLQIKSGLRITYYDAFVIFGFVLSTDNIFYKGKKEFLNIINMIFSTIYIFYVSQTRYLEFFITIIFIFFFLKKVLNDLINGRINYVFFMIMPFFLALLIIIGKSLYISVL